MFGLAIIWPFLPFVDRQVLDISILVLTYVMLGWGLNIVVGLAGLLDLGYVAFYAVGAYAYALLATTAGVSFWAALPFAGLMAATAGVLLGFPVLRLRGDYLAIVTLGFGEMVRVILLNWYSLTNGPDGISKIPPASFFGLSFKTIYDDDLNKSSAFHTYFNLEFSSSHKFIFLYFIILTLALITNIFTMRVRRLPIGRAWEALREDEIASRSLGINPRNTKLTAFGIGAMFSGFAGSFFATRQTFISPESFTFIESAIILAIVVLGGFGSQFGVVIASFILIGLPEIFRDLQQYRMLFFGLSMVVIMLWRPAGLLAHREPTIRLHPKGHDPSGGAS
jgi:branched-chain amino acid transport system permease protein